MSMMVNWIRFSLIDFIIIVAIVDKITTYRITKLYIMKAMDIIILFASILYKCFHSLHE